MQPVLQVPILPLTNYDFVIKFTPNQPFNYIKVVTRFGLVNSCFIQKGLSAKSANARITCQNKANLITVSGFLKYAKTGRAHNDEIQIALSARTIILPGRTLPIEIYTYLDSDFLMKVEQSTNSAATSLTISQAPPLQTATTLQLSDYSPNIFTILSGDMVPLNTYPANTNLLIRFVFPTQFQLGKNILEGPICHFKSYFQYEVQLAVLDQTNESDVPCNFSTSAPNMLEMELDALNYAFPLLAVDPAKPYLAVKNSLSVSNIKTPKVSGKYDIDVYLHYSGSETFIEYYRLSPIILPSPFTFTLSFTNIDSAGVSLMKISFVVPVDLQPANQNSENYYESFSQMVVKFPQVIAAQSVWSMSLGYHFTESFQPFSCWAGQNLKAYSPGLNCLLVLGRDPALYALTTSDFVSVIIQNYKAIKAGEAIEFSFFIDYSSTSIAPTVTVELYEMNEGNSVMLVSSTSTGPMPQNPVLPIPVFPSLTVQTASRTTGQLTDINLAFQTAIDYLASNNPMLVIELPAGWIVSTSLSDQSEIFLDEKQFFYPSVLYNGYKNILQILIGQDFSHGSHSLRITSLQIRANGSTSSPTKLQLYANQAVVTQSLQDLGLVACFKLAGVSIETDIKRNYAIGATYSFTWQTSNEYVNPLITIKFPSAAYFFDPAISYTVGVRIEGNSIKQNYFTAQFTSNSLSIRLPGVI